LTNPLPNSVENWHAEIWQDTLKLHDGQITEEDIGEKYSKFYAISQLTISTSNILNRFKNLNKGKPWKEQIKPFNFFPRDKNGIKPKKFRYLISKSASSNKISQILNLKIILRYNT
jgi:hypothetical protein